MLKKALIGALLLLLVILWMHNGMKMPDGLAPATIREFGALGVILYILLMAVLGGVGLPPVVFMVPAAAVWSPAWLLPMNLAGGFLACQSGFWLSRHFLHDTLSARIPEKVLQYEHRLETHGFSTVLVLRLLFFLFPPINWMLGISDISERHFRWGTLIGMLPWTLVYTFTGHGLMALLKGGKPWQLILLGAGVAIALILWARWAMNDRSS